MTAPKPRPRRPAKTDSDAAWASYYDAHRNIEPDTERLPDEPTGTKRRSELAATITVRFPAEEAARIRALAKDTGLSYSDIIRRAVEAYTRPTAFIHAGAANYALFYVPQQTGSSCDDHVELSPAFASQTCTGVLTR